MSTITFSEVFTDYTQISESQKDIYSSFKDLFLIIDIFAIETVTKVSLLYFIFD